MPVPAAVDPGAARDGRDDVTVRYAFAGLAVRELAAAAAWYERLLGRPPTFVPNETEAVWQLASTASLYVAVDAERAGGGIVTLAVADLEAEIAQIAERGIAMGAVEEIAGAGRKSVARDPDGNAIALVQVLAGS